MPFDWWEYFALAEQLGKPPYDEARGRTAVSRYYYSCHNVAKPRFTGVHTELWNAFKDHRDPVYKNIGLKGDRLREIRIWADYKNQNKSVPNELTMARVIATQLRELLNSLSAP